MTTRKDPSARFSGFFSFSSLVVSIINLATSRAGRLGVDGDRSEEIRLSSAGSLSRVGSEDYHSSNIRNCRGRSHQPKHQFGRPNGNFRCRGDTRPSTHLPATVCLQRGCRPDCTRGRPRDHVEISPLGQMLDGISQLPEIRHEKVEEIRRQIAAGSYETPEKLELALDRMLDEMIGR